MASSSEKEKFHCFSLYGQYGNNLKWSDDHKLAFTTSDLTLLSPTHLTSLHKPPLTISTATLPPTPPPHTVTLPSPTTPTEHLDPAYTQAHLSHDTITHSQWSPLHCNPQGGCVLACLTASGRVHVYMPPPSQWKEWRHAHTLTDHLHTHTTLTLSPIAEAFFTFCTAFSWFPRTLSGGRGLVAMATRSGHMVILELSLPISADSVVGVVWAEPLTVCDDMNIWGCSIAWQPSKENTLVVGCTDGRIVSVNYLSGDKTTLWTPDAVPIPHIVFLPQHLVFTKGCVLIVLELKKGKSLSWKGDPLILSGLHSLPVSGLVATNRNAVLSSGLDGTLQVWKVGEEKPCPLKTGASGHAPLAVQGLAISHNSLLAACIINERLNQDKKQGCALHFISLTDEVMDAVGVQTVTSLWDILVCLCEGGANENVGVANESGGVAKRGTYLQQLIDKCYRSGDVLSRALALQESIVREKPHSDQLLARQTALCESAQRSLNTEGIRDDVINKQSTALMLAWMTAYNAESALIYKGLCEGEVPTDQDCPICRGHVTLTEDLLSYTCPNRHSWGVCSVSFVMVSVSSECVTCAQCGAVANSLSSLVPSKDSWLYKVLTHQNQCVYCGGFYEPSC